MYTGSVLGKQRVVMYDTKTYWLVFVTTSNKTRYLRKGYDQAAGGSGLGDQTNVYRHQALCKERSAQDYFGEAVFIL